MKRCSRCKAVKAESDFHKSRKAATGLTSWCRGCYSEYFPRVHAERRALGLCDGHGVVKSECQRCKDNHYRINLGRRGLTPEQYTEMLSAQNGGCKVCAGPSGHRRFHVDHDHKTGVVRGLLCSNCNVALGQAKDSASRLMALAEYLEPMPEWIGAGC